MHSSKLFSFFSPLRDGHSSGGETSAFSLFFFFHFFLGGLGYSELCFGASSTLFFLSFLRIDGAIVLFSSFSLLQKISDGWSFYSSPFFF